MIRRFLKKFFDVLTGLVMLTEVVFATALDSESWLPTKVCIACSVYLMVWVFGYYMKGERR